MKILSLLLTIVISATCASSYSGHQSENFAGLVSAGEDVYIENQTFKETVDFTKILPANPIGNSIAQVRLVSSITFKNCFFEGEVLAYSADKDGMKTICSFQSNLSFIGCTFKQDVNFRACSVLGRTDFTACFFEKKSNFEEATFFQNTFFNQSVFHEELRFQNSFFFQRANFIDASFDNNASFQGSTFYSTAQFSNTKYFGYTDFSMINWKENVFFNYAEIAGRASFNSSWFAQNTNFINVKFGDAEMSNCQFLGKVSFMGSVVDKSLLFEDNFFLLGEPSFGSLDKEKFLQK